VLSNALGAFSPTGPNAPAPGKRMASSMSPTIVSRDGKVVLVVGSPGGDTIPNTVTQVLRDLIDYGMPVDKAASRGRVHTQLVPDVVRTEKTRQPPPAVRQALTAMGHELVPNVTPLGDAKLILIDVATGEAYGASDDREGGLAAAAKPPKRKK
jgi:gamma-glutamyltranspeptidase/glutathione hydrolase